MQVVNTGARPSYQHLLNTKVFAGVVYMDLTFTSRSSVTFPPTTTETEMLAVLAAWQGSVASPLAHWHRSCHPQDGRVAGSMAPRRGFWKHPSLPGPVKGQR
ncbi:hypothetical protein VZT92_023560 [Zoarces viviparus]|uniref:Uncharacterized protein n=1 Tax=Zoarces viviparus TaxID=48416 RepID=A0AAW1E6V6_ZOAVI